MPWHDQTAKGPGPAYGAEPQEGSGRSGPRYAVRLSLLWLAALVLSAEPAGACAPDVAPAKVQEVADKVFVRQGVHALMTAGNRGGIANIGFVIGTQAVAVIDTGGSFCDGAALRAAIRARTDLPIRAVINTHVHPDHVFGNAAFLADKPDFIGHARLSRAMAARGAHYLNANRESMGAEALAGTTIVPPSRTVADRLELDLGGRKLVIRAHATAHTDNDLTILDVMTGTLWT
ncbi:MAG: MBL fold metallo-hydrolase, partial [Methyloligellaceae bacterium]